MTTEPKASRTFDRRWLAAVVILAVAVTLWKTAGSKRHAIQVEPVTRGTAVDAVLANVVVEPRYSTTIMSSVAGTVARSIAEPGVPAIPVKQGRELVGFDTELFDIRIQNLEREIESIEQQLDAGSPKELTLDNLRQDLRISEELSQRAQASMSEIAKQRREIARLEREIAFERSERQLQKARLVAQLGVLKVERDAMRILAPADGLLTEFTKMVGNFVPAGGEIGVLLSNDVVIRASIAEEDFAGIVVGQEARVRFPGIGSGFVKGSVSHLLPTADQLSRRRDVFIHLEGEQLPLVGGMTGEASIIRERRENALIIPRRALFGQHVYVADSGEVDRRRVKKGFIGLMQAEILSGVEEGETVVVEGVSGLDDGDAVEVVESSQ